MDPDYSSLLIDDFVLPPKETQLNGVLNDVLMMLFLNAMERSEGQYRELVGAAGMEVVGIWKLGGNEEGVLEVKLRGRQR